MSQPPDPSPPPEGEQLPGDAPAAPGDAPAVPEPVAVEPEPVAPVAPVSVSIVPAPAQAGSRLAPSARRVRAFLAVNLPVAVIRRITDEIAQLRAGVASAGCKVAWVPAANLHLTLKFLGPIEPELVEGIRGALSAELSARAPFELEVRGLGAFPSLAEPRILWAGVKDHPVLTTLQKAVESRMKDLGFPPDERAFHPHLTVGRVSHGGGHGAIAPLLSAREAAVFGAGRVTEVVLYESRTLAKGAEYSPLARVPLGPG